MRTRMGKVWSAALAAAVMLMGMSTARGAGGHVEGATRGAVASATRSAMAELEGAALSFRVTIDKAALGEGPWSGRLVVLLVRDGAALPKDFDPLDGPSWDDPQPLFGVDVKDLRAGDGGGAAVVGEEAEGFPVSLKDLPPGTYRAAARLRCVRTRSDWRQESGNLHSTKAVTFVVPARASGGASGGAVEIVLDARTSAPQQPKALPEGTEVIEIRSALLSAFHGREVKLRAGVIVPIGYRAGGAMGERRYAAVYEVPGFGGDHTGAFREGEARRRNPPAAGSEGEQLWSRAFKIVLDPESPNGHTLFADSPNNGPCGRALVEELIPALEARYPLVQRPEARLLRGHSSGGWSTLWLALTYPETFGACWSSSPDPVDFRRFQQVNIYDDASMFARKDGGREIASFRKNGREFMTVRQEVGGERIGGPDNTSGGQWASWQAVWGPRNERGNPAALFDAHSGAIDRRVAQAYRAYDIGELVRAGGVPAVVGSRPNPAAIFRDRIRLAVGDADNFYLNEAVTLLAVDLKGLGVAGVASAEHPGFITMVPGVDHGTIFASKDLRAFSGQMLEHLKNAGVGGGVGGGGR